MAKINSNYDKLAAGYLFPEIAKRTNAFLNANPGSEVMRLGIGDTTEPIVSAVLDGLHQGVDDLSGPRATPVTVLRRESLHFEKPLPASTVSLELP